MHPFGIAIHLALYSLDIRIPDCIASSMRMAHIVSEMNTLATNITFRHLDTSSTPAYLTLSYFMLERCDILATVIYYQK